MGGSALVSVGVLFGKLQALQWALQWGVAVGDSPVVSVGVLCGKLQALQVTRAAVVAGVAELKLLAATPAT